MDKNVQTILGCDAAYEQADIVIFGAPFDGTASFRPGSRFAPNAIRTDSVGLETYSPYQDRDLSKSRICDIGDLEFPFGNSEKVLSLIETTAAEISGDGKIPVLIGGEHLVTLGAVSALLTVYPDLHVIQFDAHTDLRDTYLGEKLSHATVMRRIWEKIGDGKLCQFGIRSGEKEEFAFAKEHTRIHPFDLSAFAGAIDSLKGKPVYFSLDLDVLDPAVLPGTGTPEPGGVSFAELLHAIIKLRELNIVGCDINELSPIYDMSGASTAAACKIMRELLLTLKGE